MGAHLELLTGVLVDMGPLDNRVEVTLGGQGDRAAHACTGLVGGVDDELRGLVHDLMVIALQADANLLIRHRNSFLKLQSLRLSCRTLR